MNFQEKYGFYQSVFEEYITEVFNKLDGHSKLIDAMKYSALSGGKRVRPVLMLATSEILGGDIKKALPYALAIECVHTYSLIHDDLPSMDNDDLRRGKPTSHKVYGEDFAILAGDALLTFAFEHALGAITCQKGVRALKYLSECAGFSGMVGGQAYDLNPILGGGESQLLTTDILKTSKLISAPLKMAGILFDGDENALEKFGELLGIIYQFVDDLLDATSDEKTLGKAVKKDSDLGKVSAVSVYGIEKTREKIKELEVSALKCLKKIDNSEFLKIYLENSTKRLY